MKIRRLLSGQEIEFNADDLLIIEVPGVVSQEAAEQLKQKFFDRYQLNVLVLCEGMRIEAVINK